MAKKEILSFADMVEDKYKDYFVIDEEEEAKRVKAISTGSLSLDVSTGVGGIPLRRFTEIYGAESSGKTTLALGVVKNALKIYKVLYLDPEQTTDYPYIRAVVGDFNSDNLVLVQPDTAEQTMEIAELGIESKEFGLIVLDSIGALSPEKEKAEDLTSNNVALLSRLMTKFCRKNAFAVRNSDVAFLGINQVRDKIGSYMGGYETPGGHTWKHILSLRIQLSKSMDITQAGEKVGINTKFTIKKNKLAPPFRTFTLPIMFGKGIDELRDTVQFAEMLGVLAKAGPYYKFEGETLASGLVNTIEYLEEHPETLDKIKSMCYNAVIRSSDEGDTND